MKEQEKIIKGESVCQDCGLPTAIQTHVRSPQSAVLKNKKCIVLMLFIALALLIAISNQSFAYPIPLPVSWWTHDDNQTSGNISTDVISDYNTVLFKNVTTGIIGNIGQAYSLTNTLNSYIKTQNIGLYNFTNWSFEAWINIKCSPPNTSTIFNMKDTTLGTEWTLDINCNNTRYVFGTDTTGSGKTTWSPSTNFTKNNPFHLVATANSSTQKIYVNGILLGTSVQAKTGDYKNNAYVYFGSMGGTAQFFNGTFDEIKLYDYALTLSDVQLVYNNGSGIMYVSNTAPSKPVLLSPVNNTLITGIYNFSWTPSFDAENDIITYYLYLDNVLYNTTTVASINFNTAILNDSRHSWDIISYDGLLYNQSSGFVFDSDNNPPVMTLVYPDNPLNWGNGRINGYCNDTNLASFYWSADYNTTIETQNISLNPLNWTLNYTDVGQSTPHSHEYSLFCDDLAGNIINNTATYNFDLVTPECLNLAETVEINEGTEYMWDLYCIDDLNYYSLDVACVGGTDFTFYLDNINTTVYHFQETVGHLDTDMNCEFTSSDAHTKQSIAKELNKWNVKKKGNSVSVPKNDKLIEYTSAPGMTALDFDFSSVDRIKLNYKFDKNPSNKIIDYVYKVNGNDKVQYIENSLYSGWFVVDDKYWVDFELADKTGIDYIIDRINDTSWTVTLRTKRTDFNFNSVGIINTRVQKQYIRVKPAEQVSEITIGTCPVSLSGTLVLWLVVAISFGFILFGISGLRGIGILGAIGLFVDALYIVSCENMFGYLMMGAGVLFLVYFFKMNNGVQTR